MWVDADCSDVKPNPASNAVAKTSVLILFIENLLSGISPFHFVNVSLIQSS